MAVHCWVGFSVRLFSGNLPFWNFEFRANFRWRPSTKSPSLAWPFHLLHPACLLPRFPHQTGLSLELEAKLNSLFCKSLLITGFHQSNKTLILPCHWGSHQKSLKCKWLTVIPTRLYVGWCGRRSVNVALHYWKGSNVYKQSVITWKYFWFKWEVW